MGKTFRVSKKIRGFFLRRCVPQPARRPASAHSQHPVCPFCRVRFAETSLLERVARRCGRWCVVVVCDPISTDCIVHFLPCLPPPPNGLVCIITFIVQPFAHMILGTSSSSESWYTRLRPRRDVGKRARSRRSVRLDLARDTRIKRASARASHTSIACMAPSRHGRQKVGWGWGWAGSIVASSWGPGRESRRWLAAGTGARARRIQGDGEKYFQYSHVGGRRRLEAGGSGSSRLPAVVVGLEQKLNLFSKCLQL